MAFAMNGHKTAPPGPHLLTRKERRLDGFKIDIGRIDSVFDAANKITRQLPASSRIADFNECLQLPIVGLMGIITQRLGQPDGRFALIALRTQPEVDAEYRSFVGHSGKDPSKKLRLANKIFPYFERRRRIVVSIDIKKVDIRAVVQFATAQFA